MFTQLRERLGKSSVCTQMTLSSPLSAEHLLTECAVFLFFVLFVLIFKGQINNEACTRRLSKCWLLMNDVSEEE